MQRFPAVLVLSALLTAVLLAFLTGCGGGNTSTNTTVANILITPTILTLNEGGVGALTVTALNSAGGVVVADFTFTSSNINIATVSVTGLVCGGAWDAPIINCNANTGQAGVGQVTITVTSGKVSATATVYVHEQVDRMVIYPPSGCTSMGQVINATAQALNTSAPGCSPASPCDITSTVGPIGYGSNNTSVIASSSGIQAAYSPATNSPTYTSGGTIKGAAGQTCNLSGFNGVTGATATVALTGSNTIAAGTRLTVTAEGYGATVPPTTATLSNGSATCSGTATVVTRLDSSVAILSATNPGLTSIFASNSGVNSVSVPYETCRVVQITVQSATDSTTTFNLNKGGTQPLAAYVYDSKSTAIFPSLTWSSSSNAVATVASAAGTNTATTTAVAPGSAYITVSCSYPDCNAGVPAQYGQNLVTVNVAGATATNAYAAGTKSLSLIPISTTTNVAGTAITLPYLPNSIISDPAGSFLYLGSSSGLMAVNLSSNAVTVYPVNGTIVAISPNGQYMLLSDSVAKAVNYFNLASQTLTFSSAGNTTTSGAYTPDSKADEWVTGMQLMVGLPSAFTGSVPLSYTTTASDYLAEGGLLYITSSTGHVIDVRSTCDNSEVQTLGANSPTLITRIPNGTGAVAADPPAIDVVSTPSLLNANCPIITQSAPVATYDLGAGNYTARQIFMSYDASRAWIVSDLPELLGFYLPGTTPVAVPYAGGATAYSGGITPDGQEIYVGTSDGTVHRIAVGTGSDAQQIAVGLKDSNGNAVAPDLVYVQPH